MSYQGYWPYLTPVWILIAIGAGFLKYRCRQRARQRLVAFEHPVITTVNPTSCNSNQSSVFLKKKQSKSSSSSSSSSRSSSGHNVTIQLTSNGEAFSGGYVPVTDVSYTPQMFNGAPPNTMPYPPQSYPQPSQTNPPFHAGVPTYPTPYPPQQGPFMVPYDPANLPPLPAYEDVVKEDMVKK